MVTKKKVTPLLEEKKPRFPIYLSDKTYRMLRLLSLELGIPLADQISIAILEWCNKPMNVALLEQTEKKVSEVDKIFV